MTFVADAKELRTWDPERAIELKHIGGGSAGSHYFRLEFPNVSYEFAADTTFEHDPLFEEGDSRPRNRIVWHVRWHGVPVPGCDLKQTETIICEALTAYKGVHGTPERQSVRVELESASSGEAA